MNNLSNFVQGSTSQSKVQQSLSGSYDHHTQTIRGGKGTYQKRVGKHNYPHKQGCYFCDELGHKKAQYYVLRKHIRRDWRACCYFPEPKCFGKVWIAKRNLYSLDMAKITT